jgi:hypothetical protein
MIQPLLAGSGLADDFRPDDVAYVEDLGLIRQERGGPIEIARRDLGGKLGAGCRIIWTGPARATAGQLVAEIRSTSTKPEVRLLPFVGQVQPFVCKDFKGKPDTCLIHSNPIYFFNAEIGEHRVKSYSSPSFVAIEAGKWWLHPSRAADNSSYCGHLDHCRDAWIW